MGESSFFNHHQNPENVHQQMVTEEVQRAIRDLGNSDYANYRLDYMVERHVQDNNLVQKWATPIDKISRNIAAELFKLKVPRQLATTINNLVNDNLVHRNLRAAISVLNALILLADNRTKIFPPASKTKLEQLLQTLIIDGKHKECSLIYRPDAIVHCLVLLAATGLLHGERGKEYLDYLLNSCINPIGVHKALTMLHEKGLLTDNEQGMQAVSDVFAVANDPVASAERIIEENDRETPSPGSLLP